MARSKPTIKIRVRFAETDQMGVAHHSSYAVWLEAARIEWLRKRAISYAEIERSGTSLAVAGLNICYRRAAAFDDLIAIWASLDEVLSRRMTFSYILEGEDGLLLATAQTLHIPTGRSGGATRLPEVWRNRLRPHVNNV